MHNYINMKMYKYIPMFILSILLVGCGGGTIGVGPGVTPSGALVVTLDDVSPNNGAIDLAWASNGTDFTVVRDGEDLTSLTYFQYQDDTVDNGTRYCYQVRATNAAGESVTSDTECATAMADVALAITNQSFSAILNWAKVKGATSYKIYAQGVTTSLSAPKNVEKADGDGGTLIANVVSPPYEWIDLSNCKTYPVKVLPVDIDGKESVSNVSYLEVMPRIQGELDTSFGTDGVILDDALFGQFYDVQLFSDGRIAALHNDGGFVSSLLIYNSDGSPNDVIDLSGNPNIDIEQARAAAIDGDDNIYVAGGNDDLRICKLNSAGVLDTTFGQIGNPGCYYRGGAGVENSHANDVVINSSGDLIMTGNIQGIDTGFAIWRMTSDGDLVWEYEYTVGGEFYEGMAVTIQGDSIVAAGSSNVALELMVVSVDSDGNLQGMDFNSGAGGETHGYGVASAPDGSVIATGTTANLAGEQFLPIWNYAADATLFDLYLYTLTSGAGSGSAGLDIQYDCRDNIVATGFDLDGSARIVVMRADDTFNIDTNFGNIDPTNGWFLYYSDVYPSQFGYRMTQDDLGRIYSAGVVTVGWDYYPILMRLE